jgi:hypothetical protein
VAIDVSLGLAIPGHEAAKFASKQDSLHAIVVERCGRPQGARLDGLVRERP